MNNIEKLTLRNTLDKLLLEQYAINSYREQELKELKNSLCKVRLDLGAVSLTRQDKLKLKIEKRSILIAVYKIKEDIKTKKHHIDNQIKEIKKELKFKKKEKKIKNEKVNDDNK